MNIRGNLLRGEARFIDAPIGTKENMNLADYIAQHHNSNQSEFARSQGVRHDQVARWLKRNCMVVNGVVYCEVSKQTKIKQTGE